MCNKVQLRVLLLTVLLFFWGACVAETGKQTSKKVEPRKQATKSSVVKKQVAKKQTTKKKAAKKQPAEKQEAASKQPDFTDPLKSIMVKQSQPVFSVVLKSNPTTGYSWLLKNYDSELITPVRSKFFKSTSKKLVGAPGYEKWTFRVKPKGFVVPQMTNIVLVYTHPWDDQGAQATNFRVVTINAN